MVNQRVYIFNFTEKLLPIICNLHLEILRTNVEIKKNDNIFIFV